LLPPMDIRLYGVHYHASCPPTQAHLLPTFSQVSSSSNYPLDLYPSRRAQDRSVAVLTAIVVGRHVHHKHDVSRHDDVDANTFELSNTKPSAGAAPHTDADSLSLTIVFGVLGLLVAVVGISIAVLQLRHTLRRAKTIEIFELACRAET
jgi:hypothetical protein